MFLYCNSYLLPVSICCLSYHPAAIPTHSSAHTLFVHWTVLTTCQSQLLHAPLTAACCWLPQNTYNIGYIRSTTNNANTTLQCFPTCHEVSCPTPPSSKQSNAAAVAAAAASYEPVVLLLPHQPKPVLLLHRHEHTATQMRDPAAALPTPSAAPPVYC